MNLLTSPYNYINNYNNWKKATDVKFSHIINECTHFSLDNEKLKQEIERYIINQNDQNNKYNDLSNKCG